MDTTPELWSPAAREAYAATVTRVRAALDRHTSAVAEAGAGDTAALDATATELESALGAMSEAEQTLTGAAAFWLETDDLDDPDGPDTPDTPDSEPADEPSDGPTAVVADLQLTMDVTDADQLIALAREVDPAASVSTVEDAIFVVTGRSGWDQLLADQVDGVTMQGAVAQLTRP